MSYRNDGDDIMDVKEAIENRRAYRALSPIEITNELIKDLAIAASLAPSCFNNQPWNYVFVRSPDRLLELHDAYSKGNEWVRDASLVIAVFSQREKDCIIREREYYAFDTGLATANLILRATELGLVAHPIAGFSPRKVRSILYIPDDMEVITLIIVGKHSDDTEAEPEKDRPIRKTIEEFIHIDNYGNGGV